MQVYGKSHSRQLTLICGEMCNRLTINLQNYVSSKYLEVKQQSVPPICLQMISSKSIQVPLYQLLLFQGFIKRDAQRADCVKKLVVFRFFFHRSQKMVMNKLIEPALNLYPPHPRGNIFCFIVLIVFDKKRLNRNPLSFVCISGGRGPSLSTSLTSQSHDLRPRKKASFKMVAILCKCFSSKYAIFRKNIIPFKVVNRKNNFW